MESSDGANVDREDRGINMLAQNEVLKIYGLDNYVQTT